MYEVPGFAYSFISDPADRARPMAVRQFRGIVITAAGAVEAGADVVIDGVAQMDGPNLAPETIRIMKEGVSKGIAGDVVPVGTVLITDAEGRFVPIAGGANPVGKALTASAGAGEHISVLLY